MLDVGTFGDKIFDMVSLMHHRFIMQHGVVAVLGNTSLALSAGTEHYHLAVIE